MRNAYRLVFIILLLFSHAIIFSQDQPKKKKNIAVIDLESRGGLSASEIGTLTDRLRSMLVRTRAFNVVDRGRMQNILEEQGFQMSGCTSTECAVEAGMILGVEEMVSGTIGRIGKLYTIDIILINVESSRIIKSLTRDYTGEIEGLVLEMKSIANELANIDDKPAVTAAGGLKVETDPEGAEVIIDGVSKGVTPITIPNIPAGKHTLKLKKSGHIDYDTEINIVANQVRPISTELRKQFILSVTSTPAGADVFVNNRKVGKTPFRSYAQEDAELIVELRLANHEPWKEDITMDQHQNLKADLEAIAADGQPGEEGGGSSTWLWIGAGAVAVGAAAFLLMPQDDGGGDPGTYTAQGFPTPPARP